METKDKICGRISCCLGCEQREIGCHSTCEKYKKEREMLNKRNEMIVAQKEYEKEELEIFLHSYRRYQKLSKWK